jgi:hypothetical protein
MPLHKEQLDVLYNELFYLDEVVGELNEEDNAKIDEQRRDIKRRIDQLMLDGSDGIDCTL